MSQLRELYPPVEPYDTGFFDTGDGHRIYYEQSGNPHGKPALFVHGGPGGGGDTNARRFFDAGAYRIVVFDQRGAGRSEPHASLESNTTPHLIADIEKLRALLGIERWLVFGGSWGSTLSLAYAEAHPEAVSELVLRGIFMLRDSEIDWFYRRGANALFPEYWEQLVEPLSDAERGDVLAAYHARLTCGDRETELEAARRWSLWEGATSCLIPNEELKAHFSSPEFALPLARIEAHYFVNRGFFDRPEQLLEDVERLRAIPGVIVQGRYDLVCPVETAWALSRRWPEAELELVDAAGHSAYEPGITDRLVAATERFAKSAR